jgi:NAD(P)H-quinone oxidoreductase subunit 5
MIQSIHQYAWIIPILPTLSATVLGFGLLCVRRILNSQRWISAFVSIFILFTTMLLSIAILSDQIAHNFAHRELWTWLNIGGISLEIGYLVDPLSSIMLVLVTSVALAVMIYTHGYMQHDKSYVRFFVYLSLFTASMLGLILSPNLVQIYIFWELVGMCSYLLVGFWFARPSAAYACQKAFITNRVGDLGLLLGILGIYWLTGSLEFSTIASNIQEQIANNTIPEVCLIACCICLFLGPVAKSAQFPLHVWLPDAMEGPTPISALIHAATMVAAGVFLVARLLPLFEQIPLVMDIVACTGGITALLGATMALAQKDLKKGLAYSTMSQLGYMILALGVGSYQSGLFHLITHAYSKALLFLGSGSVIHSLEPIVGYHPEKCQNMRYMGGLRQYMPITAITFFIGTLSLCGVPPFACFWSKDEILTETWHKFPILGIMAWLTAGLTAFYMFRIYLLTFEGKFRGSDVSTQTNIHKNDSSGLDLGSSFLPSHSIYPHESSWSMTIPLIILTVPTVLIGLIGAPIPNGLPNSSLLSHWFYTDVASLYPYNGWANFFVNALPSIGIGIIGISVAWLVYGPNVKRLYENDFHLDPIGKGRGQGVLDFIYSWSLRRAYIDEFYDKTLVLLTHQVSKSLAWMDKWGIDGLVNFSGLILLIGGEGIRYTEGGRITTYIFILTSCFAILLIGNLLYIY